MMKQWSREVCEGMPRTIQWGGDVGAVEWREFKEVSEEGGGGGGGGGLGKDAPCCHSYLIST